ncbi:hypothetical protein D030_3342A, partial [Vibrio parahaemolyticus AQ3810]
MSSIYRCWSAQQAACSTCSFQSYCCYSLCSASNGLTFAARV